MRRKASFNLAGTFVEPLFAAPPPEPVLVITSSIHQQHQLIRSHPQEGRIHDAHTHIRIRQAPSLNPTRPLFTRCFLLAEFRDPNAPVTANTAAVEHRKKFYMHAQQEALFPSLLFTQQQRDDGWLQKTDVVTFLRGSTEEQRRSFPPVYIVHGEKDSAVDVDHARRLVTSKIAGPFTRELYVGKFPAFIQNADRNQAGESIRRLFTSLFRHVKHIKVTMSTAQKLCRRDTRLT
ncbi:hypothetical protein NDA11_006918 [Ustilago hordei]|uniref:Uncharacterized protein n=1 Tax=Ustilago hordei TaxID=120017 RepID=I2FZD4_USTHO|nr:hypothetical protein NDA10_005217 [Ustilago hordei]KAJ1576854.1 hypothetical protein NDA15_001376 [Ustilago hordei]KAJ1578560.1 hypothetical protein NDA12_001932 [Ustilago hordei]KAJ1584220.1 hypothetical protein NDA11_006918 [Ustilago hordei]KAJ1599318.1 hypothetical protein NDA14_006642 [Ustilago hordei]